jgi:molecular chaperone DnaK
VEVSFKIDANGILNVSAKDMATGKEQSVEIKGSSGLDGAEVERMRKDAETHAEDDKKRRHLVDLKNQGDSMVYQMEKMLTEQGEKVSAEDRSNIESGISSLREALKGDDARAIERAMKSLEASSHKVAEQMYKSAGAAPGGGQAAPGEAPRPQEGKGGDDVIDAEFEVKE